MSSAGWSDPAARWLLLAPDGAVPVQLTDRFETARLIRALPAGTPVALVGRWGLRSTARQADLDLDATYVSLPSTSTPVAVTRSNVGLAWVAQSVLTVPPGRSRGHLAATLATRIARRAPWLLRLVGGRVLMGIRR